MIGIDMVRIQRIAQVKQRDMFIKRILTLDEQEIYYNLSTLRRQNEWLAGRFALKESIIKAVDGFISMSDINIQVNNRKLSFVFNEQILQLSVSHDKDYAIAVAFTNQ